MPGPRLPLGARREVEYESISISMKTGERLLLLTDGRPEAPTPGGDPLGYEILDLIPRLSASTADLLDTLFASVRQASGSALEDDWTALALEALAPGRSPTP